MRSQSVANNNRCAYGEPPTCSTPFVGKGALRIGATIFLIIALSCGLSAENLEKAQKKELESQAKAMIAEAKALENSGQLAAALAKYAESQAMIETKDAANAIKHLDDEIHKRVKDALNNSRKLYAAHKYMEAVATLEEGEKLGSSSGMFSSGLAFCYYQLSDYNKAVENLDKAITATPDPKEKLKLQQLLTSFTTGESGATASQSDRDQIAQFNRLADSIGFDASLEDDESPEEQEAFSSTDAPATQLLSGTSLKTSHPHAANNLSITTRKLSMCAVLEGIKGPVADSPSAIFDRAGCAEINGRPTEAVRLLQRYLEAAPRALDAGGVHERIAQLQSLIALPQPHGGQTRRLFAAANGYLAERKYDRSLASFLKAKQSDPDFPLTYWDLGLLYEAMGNIDLAGENFTRYQQLTSDQALKDEANLHLSTLTAKKSKYDEEVNDAEDIFADLFNRGMNLAFNQDAGRSAIRARRAQIKKKQDQKKDRYRVGGFAVPYAYAQQALAQAGEHLQIALALFPLAPEANELMGLLFLQANDGRAAIKNFDAVASQSLPVAFYAEMRGHKLDHGVKCELTGNQVRLIYLSSYDKKGNAIAPDKPGGDDGLGDMILVPSDERHPFDSLDLNLSDIKRVETNRGLLTIKLAKQEFTLAPIYLASYTPVEGPPARRFANNYTRLFIRYPGLEDSKLGVEGMTGGEKFAMGYKLATSGLNIATNLNPIGAIQATQSAISIARTIHATMASLSVSFASWERSVDDQRQLLSGPSFKPLLSEPVTLTLAEGK